MEKTEPACQVVRALDVIGEKWSLLVVRNALRGQTRFSEFQAQLGIPSDILSARLTSLVAKGVLEKRPYRQPGGRERFSYHLTPAGEGLQLVVAAMIQWTDEFTPAPQGAASLLVDAAGEPLELAFVDASGAARPADDVVIAPGPASSWVVGRIEG